MCFKQKRCNIARLISYRTAPKNILKNYSNIYVQHYVTSPQQNFMNILTNLITYLLTPWCRVFLEKLTGFTAGQEIPHISRNPKVHYRTHKRPPPVSILGQPNPDHTPTSHLLEIHPNIIHPFTTRSSQWSPSLLFPHQHPIHPLSIPIRATCPAHLIILDFITRTLLGEDYKSFSSLLCTLLHSPITSSLLGPNILLNTMFSNTLSFLSSRSVNDHTWKKIS